MNDYKPFHLSVNLSHEWRDQMYQLPFIINSTMKLRRGNVHTLFSWLFRIYKKYKCEQLQKIFWLINYCIFFRRNNMFIILPLSLIFYLSVCFANNLIEFFHYNTEVYTLTDENAWRNDNCGNFIIPAFSFSH